MHSSTAFPFLPPRRGATFKRASDLSRRVPDSLTVIPPEDSNPASGHHLDDIPIFVPPKPLDSVGSDRWHWSKWPKIGSDRLVVSPSQLFDTPAFLDRYRPGETREVYAAAAPGLSQLARHLNVALFKIGDCARSRIPHRMRELSADHYGALFYANGNVVRGEGFDAYFPSCIDGTLRLSANSPVKTTNRNLNIILPDTMCGQEFSAAFEEAMASASLFHWIKSNEATRLCRARRVDPAVGERYTLYAWGDNTRQSPATEFYCCRTYHDGDRLAVIAEQIILRHMCLIA